MTRKALEQRVTLRTMELITGARTGYRKRRLPRWFEGWSYKIELLGGQMRRYTFQLPHSVSKTSRKVQFETHVDSPEAVLFDVTVCAFEQLGKPTKAEWVNKA